MIREVHPEILFWALNHGVTVVERKKQSTGFSERVAILDRHFPDTARLIAAASETYRRHQVARDDIVDALAAAVTAWQGSGIYQTISDTSEMDREGLPMEMVYAKTGGMADLRTATDTTDNCSRFYDTLGFHFGDKGAGRDTPSEGKDDDNDDR